MLSHNYKNKMVEWKVKLYSAKEVTGGFKVTYKKYTGCSCTVPVKTGFIQGVSLTNDDIIQKIKEL